MARTLNSLTISAPAGTVNIDDGANFALSVTPGFAGGGVVNAYSLDFQWDQGTATWVSMGTASDLNVPTPNPVTGLTATTDSSKTVTALLNSPTGTYNVRVVGNGSVISDTRQVNVTGESPTPVQNTFAMSWNVITAVQITAAMSWNVIAAVQATFAMSWDVFGVVPTKDAVAKALSFYSWSDGTKRSKEESPVVFPDATWETRTAAQVGMSQTQIDALQTALGGRGFLVKGGYQIAAWNETAKIDWASTAKPVTATLLLFAVKEALLTSVTDLVEGYGWTGQFITKDEPMQFLHLANMVSGYMRAEAPGAAWAYNDYAVNLFAATLFDSVFGASGDTIMLDSARMGSLQFQDGSFYTVRSNHGISTSCRDMARIGWFWRNRGNWNGVQLLAESYFDSYMQSLVAGSLPRTTGTDANGDYLVIGTLGGGTDQSAIGPGVYGLGWWFNDFVGQSANRLFPSAPTDLFMAQGHFGDETLVIIPSLDLVFASTSALWGNLATDAGVADSTMDTMMALLASTVL